MVPKGLFEYDLHNVNVILTKPFNRSNCYIKKNIFVNMILFVLHDTLKYMIINMLELVKIMTDYSDVVFHYG